MASCDYIVYSNVPVFCDSSNVNAKLKNRKKPCIIIFVTQ